jgi:hypothetical protein
LQISTEPNFVDEVVSAATKHHDRTAQSTSKLTKRALLDILNNISADVAIRSGRVVAVVGSTEHHTPLLASCPGLPQDELKSYAELNLKSLLLVGPLRISLLLIEHVILDAATVRKTIRVIY